MEHGCSSANTGLSWIERGKFESFAFVDKDLSGAGLRKMLPWKGFYFHAWKCGSCEILTVDYSEKFDRKSVELENSREAF